MIRELAKKLATFNQFADCVIIEAKFQRGHFDEVAEILKDYSSMIFIRLCSANAELLIKLIRPRREIKAAFGSRIKFDEKIWRVFTASEIFDFVETVGDKNLIYQFNPPIVPALLILDTLCKEFSPNFIKLKFKNFITAGEPLTLNFRGNRFEILSAGVKKISGQRLL